MARALYVAPVQLELVAQVAALRARVAELETEVAALRATADSDLDAEFQQVARADEAQLAPTI